MLETKFIFLTSLQSFSSSFPLLFHVISTDILKLPPWFPTLPLWFPTFFVFPPRFPAFPRWFSAPAFPSHSWHSHPYYLHFLHSILQFSILALTDSLLSLYSLRNYFKKIVALVKKPTLPFLVLHNSRHQIIIYIIYDVISVITKNCLYYSASSKKYIICEIWTNNSEWLKYYLSFISKGGTTCLKLSIFFCNLCQFIKIYVTNFFPR